MTTGPFLHPFAPAAKPREGFITIVRGEGARIWDDKGNEYVDSMGGLWYLNVGHGCRPIIDAVHEQMSKLAVFHCFDPFTNEPAEELTAKVASIAPLDDPRVFLTTSGSESVDAAMKLARLAHVRAGHPERTIIVSRTVGYHGTTYGGTSAQGIAPNREGWGPLVPEVVQVPQTDLEAMANLFKEHGARIAAVITEPVQGAGGVFPPPDGYLQGVRRLCDDHGAFLIADEVICGFGRLGTWFGCQFYGVRPDLLTFAKAVTSGYVPLGGVVVGAKVRGPLESDPSFVLRTGHTYSGHPTSCAAGVACLGVIERDGLVDRARHVGQVLGDGLRSLHTDGLLAEVRGEGAMFGVRMIDGKDPSKVRDLLLERGVVVRALVDSVVMCPPLVITDDEIGRVVDQMAAVLSM